MGLHEKVEQLAEKQRGLVATWQLVDDGCKKSQVEHAASQMRKVHDGVFLTGHAPLTDWLRWKSATLTAPATVLADWSCGAYYGFHSGDRFPTTVRRPGSGGSRVFGAQDSTCLGSVRVGYSDALERDTVERDDIAMLSPGRALIDLVAKVGESKADRMVREVLRLKVATAIDLRIAAGQNRGRRGVARVRRLVDLYAPLALERTRSDAEALALAILEAAGHVLPAVNVVVAGHEADLVDSSRRLLVELDGPQYHQFLQVDAEKQAAWEIAGWVVRRLPTDDVYDHPELLISRFTDEVTDAERAVSAATRGPADVLPRLSASRDPGPSVRLDRL